MNKQISRLILPLLLVSCSGGGSKDSAVTAIHSGTVTRNHWQEERRPVVIKTDTALTECIGVSMLLDDATADELDALESARFTLRDGLYRANDPNALTSDSTAMAAICYPVHRGAKATSAIEMKAPFGENLYGRETGRTFGTETRISYEWRSGMALLRIITESDDTRDRLDGLTISGDHIYNTGLYMPYTGEWCRKEASWSIDAPYAGCLLNNGRNHDFFLIPTDTACSMSIRAVINGTQMAIRKIMPPMHAGSITELHLRMSGRGLAVCSSWAESRRALYIDSRKNIVMDSIIPGYFLRSDGYVTTARDNRTIAVVFETNGRHGKAVATDDCDGRYVFSAGNLTSGKSFETIDGKRREGILNPGTRDGVADANKVIWTPKMPYDDRCAIGYTDGAALTHMLRAKGDKATARSRSMTHEEMMAEVMRHSGAYVPSLGELVRLYYQVKQRKVELPGLSPLEGEYLTSNESGSHYYMIDFSTGIITSSLSKQYGASKLRLFYQF